MDNNIIETVPAKTIVTKSKSQNWFGMDYNMNIYRGCCHGCIYCDSRSECYRVDDFDSVRQKENALEIIRGDLRRKREKGVIATGAMSDPYNRFEKRLELTRGALKLVEANGFGIAIDTKGTLVTRDIDVLERIKHRSPVLIKMTITTYDDALCKLIEPHAPLSSQRFEAVRELSGAGIFSGILMMPILPFINDTKENVLGIARRAHECGAKFIYPSFGLTLRDRQRSYFYGKLDECFPGLKKEYMRSYGGRYNCQSGNAKMLYSLFSAECERLGLLYKMKDIIKAYKCQYDEMQTSLFT